MKLHYQYLQTIKFAHLNDDGQLDIVAQARPFSSSDDDYVLTWFKNNATDVSTPSFEARATIPCSGGTAGFGMATGDFNNDNLDDIALMKSTYVYFLENNGSEVFIERGQHSVSFYNTYSPGALITGHLDDDDLLDMALVNKKDGRPFLYSNTGVDFSFDYTPLDPTTSRIIAFRWEDMDGDGRKDILTLTEDTELYYYRNYYVDSSSSTLFFRETPRDILLNCLATNFTAEMGDFLVADMNADGVNDVVGVFGNVDVEWFDGTGQWVDGTFVKMVNECWQNGYLAGR